MTSTGVVQKKKASLARDDWFVSDAVFSGLFPPSMKVLSRNHWTPIRVVRKAVDFLAIEKGARILDLGSGIGKFCLSAACFKPEAQFTGVELRKELVDYAESAKETLGLENVRFIHSDIFHLDFANFDHFYFYNAFHEHIVLDEKIDSTIPCSKQVYENYHFHLAKQLEKMPPGTRVAAYDSPDECMPPCYHIGGSDFSNLLKYWVRE